MGLAVPDPAAVWAAAQAAVGDLGPVLVAGAVVVVALAADRALTRLRLWRVARRLGGRLVRGRGLPAVAWTADGATARLGYARGGGGRCTRAEAEVPGAASWTMTVRRRGLLGPLALWLPAGRDEVRTRHGAFDRAFHVRSATPGAARACLDREARGLLLRLACLPGGGALRVDVQDGRATVSLAGLLTGAERLAFLGRASAWLARAVAAAAGPGRARLARPAEPSRAPCPTCAEAVDETAIACPSCRAAHHPACWAWLGGCGAYACAAAPRRVAA